MSLKAIRAAQWAVVASRAASAYATLLAAWSDACDLALETQTAADLQALKLLGAATSAARTARGDLREHVELMDHLASDGESAAMGLS